MVVQVWKVGSTIENVFSLKLLMMVLSMVASTENRRHILVFRREDGIMCI
jgi:hypothetical protein